VVYDQAHEILGGKKFEPLWKGPYIVKKCLGNKEYIMECPKGDIIPNPCNKI